MHVYGGSTNALSCRSYPFACPVTSAFSFFSRKKEGKNQSRLEIRERAMQSTKCEQNAQNTARSSRRNSGMRFFGHVSLRLEVCVSYTQASRERLLHAILAFSV